MTARSEGGSDVALLLVAGLILAMIAASLGTHVWCTACRREWAFLVLGVLAYPVGMIHGVGIWLHVWR